MSPTNKSPIHSVYMPSSSVAKITLRNPSPQNYVRTPAVYLYTTDDLADSIVPAHVKEVSPKHKVKVKLNGIKNVDCGKDPRMTFKPKTNTQRRRVSLLGNPGSVLSPSYPNADIVHSVTPYGQGEKITSLILLSRLYTVPKCILAVVITSSFKEISSRYRANGLRLRVST